MVVDNSFWKNKRVFVTGHTGFKGGWLCLWLQSMGAKVTGFSLPAPTTPSIFCEASVGSNMSSIVGDIRDLEAVSSALKKADPQYVFHLAAQPLVRRSYSDPVETFSTNVMGTVNLLEAARKLENLNAILNVTTDKCYQNHEWDWGYRESDELGGHDPYSNSKACSELVTASFRSSYYSGDHPRSGNAMSIATARAGNVIGGGDWAEDRLIPDVIRSLMDGEVPQIRNPSSIRPWQHVLDPLAGYLILAQAMGGSPGEYSEAWNFGPSADEAKPVSWIVNQLCTSWGDNSIWERPEGQSQLHETKYLKLDTSKAQNRLGWKPQYSIIQAIAMVVEWSQAHNDGVNMREFTLSQISKYPTSINHDL